MIGESGYYEDEYNLDDSNAVDLKFANYNGKVTVCLYGTVINSADPLVVLLNNEVIRNEKRLGNYKIPAVWEQFYLDKTFVVKIDKLKRNAKNELHIISGNATKKYYLNVY